MGFIDADVHGLETGRRTWEYFDPNERHYGPPPTGPWVMENFVLDPTFPRQQLTLPQMEQAPDIKETMERMNSFYPEGARDLSNIPARLKHMDELGVDVQVCYSNFWLVDGIQDPTREAALSRSWNRWAAEGTRPSKGRIRWMAHIPWRTQQRAFEEMEFAAKNGASGFEFTGYKYEIAPGNPWWYPLYAKAQDLDLCVAFHLGGNAIQFQTNPEDYFYRTMSRVPGSFVSIAGQDVPAKFPSLRFGFIESGCAWVPFALSALVRANNKAIGRRFGDWRPHAKDYMSRSKLYVAALLDDDINYVLPLLGEDKLMMGTDYTHLDVGSDPDGLRVTARRTDVDKRVLRKVLDSNARTFYGIKDDYRPADKAAELALAGVA